MKYLAVGAALACVFTLAACTDQQKCVSAKIAYDEFVDSGRGGAAEKSAAKKAYDKAKAICAAKGINI